MGRMEKSSSSHAVSPAHPASSIPVILAGFAAFLSLYAPQPLLPLFQRVFNASHLAVSLTVTATTIAVAAAAPFVGGLADTWGKRRVIVISSFLLGATTLLAATATTLAQVVAWRFAQGLVTPGVFAATVAYIHDQWHSSRAGAVTAAYVTGTVVGGFVGRVVSGLVAGAVGWRASFAVTGVLSLMCAIALLLWLPHDRPHEADGAGESRRRSLAAHLTSRPLIGTYAAGFCVLFTQIATFTYVTFHLAGPPFGLSTAALGWLFTVYLAGALAAPIAGRWVDAYGHRSGLVAAIVLGVIGSFLTLGHVLISVITGLALVCSGVFAAQAAANSYIGVAAARDRGLAVGLYATFYYIGGSVGGSVPALVWNRGGWPACVALIVVVQVLTAAIGWEAWADRRVRFGGQETVRSG
jgi:MFS transporter, YNFM family, putative membrane transport protein